MTSRVLCRYYKQGTCTKGSACPFSHDLANAPDQMLCKYYLAGFCSYGDKCRYDHVRPSGTRAATTLNLSASAGTISTRRLSNSSSSTPASTASSSTQAVSTTGSARTQPASAQPAAQKPVDGSSRRRVANAWTTPDAHDETPHLPQPLQVPVTSPPPHSSNVCRHAPATAPASDHGRAGDSGNTTGSQHSSDSGDDAWESADPHFAPAAAAHAAAACHSPPSDLDDCPGFTLVDDDLGLLEEASWLQQRQQQRLPSSVEPDDEAAFVAEDWEGPEGQEDGEDQLASAYEDWEGEDVDPAQLPLCALFAPAGSCVYGEECDLVHGEKCETCDQYVLHPYNVEMAEEHAQLCAAQHARRAAAQRSAAVECGVCLEPVMSKQSTTERRFGLLACDHAFCLSCIRSWRSTDGAADLETALRTCPICRTPSHFVTPSTSWPSSPEEKDAIIAGYLGKLAGMDCKHFAKGLRRCPFGSSCFFKHAYADGTLEAISRPRRCLDGQGAMQVVQEVRLSTFFETPGAQQTFARF